MARWSDVGQPDDPLRGDDDALVRDEDVLLDAADADDVSPPDLAPADTDVDDAGFDDAPPALDDSTSIIAMDDRPTTEIQAVVAPESAPAPRGRLAGVAPWAVFVAVAVVVIAATSTLASWLQGPTADRQAATPRLDPVPTVVASAPPAAPTSQAAPPPEPTVEPEPEPDPEPVARPTRRPRATTRAPAPAPRSESPQPSQPPPPPAAVADAGPPPDTQDAQAQEEATGTAGQLDESRGREDTDSVESGVEEDDGGAASEEEDE